MFARYVRMNTARPLLTKSLISGSLLGAADCTCQHLDRHKSTSSVTATSSSTATVPFDAARVARMLTWGLLVNGPSGHMFYTVLERWVRSTGLQGAGRQVALKITVDQLAYTPPLTFAFFVYQSALAGSSAELAVGIACRETPPTLLYNWGFWGVAHVLTFTIIPLEHRVAWVALKNFAWSGFLSWRLNRCDASTGGGQEEEASALSGRHAHSAHLLRRYSSR